MRAALDVIRAATCAFALAAVGCRTIRPDPQEVRRATARCPGSLPDAALDSPSTHEACPLPPAVAELVRNDYADEELEMPDLASLGRHARQVPRSAFEAQLSRFIDPHGALLGFAVVDAAAGTLRPDPLLAPDVAVPFAPEAPGAPDCRGTCAGRLLPPLRPDLPYRPERRAELRALATRERPLAGLRVVVDPGHAGGPFAAMEERRVEYRPSPAAPPLVVQEGDLTLRTALELRARLITLGAEVALTREAPGLVHPQPLRAFRPAAVRLLGHVLLDPRYAALERALSPPERLRLHAALVLYAVRRQSRFESLRQRARIASAFRPDLVLSVHYNAGPFPTGTRAGQEIVAMVAGAHAEGRLYHPYYRWLALEQALAPDDFGASAHLGALCARALSGRLGIPLAGEPRYPDHLAVRDRAGRPVGVDAWDGVLLRYLGGPAALVEGPYMNERDELPRLAAALASPAGTPGTRTDEYAEALARCVQAFASRWLSSERNPFGPM